MLDIRTGKSMTRREALTGLSAIIATGCAPFVASAAIVGRGRGGLVRGVASKVFFHSLKFSSMDYVTDGLVHHWDGIDNAVVSGTRVHDSSAATWKDLVGSWDMTLTNATWSDLGCTTNTGRMFYNSQFEITTGMTIEFVGIYRYSYLFRTSQAYSSGMKIISGVNNNNFNAGCGGTLATVQGTGLTNGKPCTITVGYVGTNVMSVFANGVKCTFEKGAGGSINVSGSVSFIGEYDTGDGSGTAYGGRLYNRVLTDEEIIKNQMIDKVRFGIV